MGATVVEHQCVVRLGDRHVHRIDATIVGRGGLQISNRAPGAVRDLVQARAKGPCTVVDEAAHGSLDRGRTIALDEAVNAIARHQIAGDLRTQIEG